jgi:hypothetical protein
MQRLAVVTLDGEVVVLIDKAVGTLIELFNCMICPPVGVVCSGSGQ